MDAIAGLATVALVVELVAEAVVPCGLFLGIETLQPKVSPKANNEASCKRLAIMDQGLDNTCSGFSIPYSPGMAKSFEARCQAPNP